MSRTTSPSRVVISRSTPWVAGWCGPRLSVSSSSWSGCSRCWSSTLDSISRYVIPGIAVGAGLWVTSLIALPPPRGLRLVVGEEDGLAAHREVTPLRMADVVLGHQD